MQLVGIDQMEADPIFRAVAAEIARLEAIFSLYRPDSAISRLNRNGALHAPPAELLQICSLSSTLHRATKGAFDPTIQPLWRLAAKAAALGEPVSNADTVRAHALLGWTKVRFDPERIAFETPDMAVTFNGIAQGFITDRIADKLRNFGLPDVLIDIGEIRAWGAAPDGAAWRVGIATPMSECCADRITLSNRALATSANFGTIVDAAGKRGHIFNPKAGVAAAHRRQVSVSAPRADLADGLSTALCAAEPWALDAALAEFPQARLEHLAV
ncbi:MAG: FAD:protein FMN transferase [Rhodobacter sp.]|nr:FAD:protein FMN transferase [Rhodobacter sp.]